MKPTPNVPTDSINWPNGEALGKNTRPICTANRAYTVKSNTSSALPRIVATTARLLFARGWERRGTVKTSSPSQRPIRQRGTMQAFPGDGNDPPP